MYDLFIILILLCTFIYLFILNFIFKFYHHICSFYFFCMILCALSILDQSNIILENLYKQDEFPFIILYFQLAIFRLQKLNKIQKPFHIQDVK
ncbi:transmembrane protein, putative, partial (macronuclear) [Tetrahymena thermophila SB210]